MPDENDVLFNEYSVDFFGFLKLLFSGGRNGSDEGGIQSGIESTSSAFSNFIDFLSTFWSVFTVLSWLLSALLIFGLIYAYIRGSQLDQIQHEGVLKNEQLYAELYGTHTANQRWDDVVTHIASDNPSEWRLAVIEADIMLEEVLEAAGYAGTSISERLKSISPQALETLDQAWEAHLVRNKIAHQGADFVLTKKIAQTAVNQYQMVFTEFGVL